MSISSGKLVASGAYLNSLSRAVRTKIAAIAFVVTQAPIVLGQTTALPAAEQMRACSACQADNYDRSACESQIVSLRDSTALAPRDGKLLRQLAECTWNRSVLSRESPDDLQRTRTEAIAMLRQSIRLDSSDIEAKYELSAWTRDAQEKEQLLQEILRAYPADTRARADLARTEVSLGRYDDAFREFMTYLSQESIVERQALMNAVTFGRQLGEGGRVDLAIQVFERALDKSTSLGRFDQCSALSAIDPSVFAAQTALVSRVAALRPYCTDIEHRNTAVALIAKGSIDEAIKELEVQININQKYEEAYLLLARLYRQQGNGARAFDVLKRYISQESDPELRCRKFRDSDVRSLGSFDQDFIRMMSAACGL